MVFCGWLVFKLVCIWSGIGRLTDGRWMVVGGFYLYFVSKELRNGVEWVTGSMLLYLFTLVFLYY